MGKYAVQLFGDLAAEDDTSGFRTGIMDGPSGGSFWERLGLRSIDQMKEPGTSLVMSRQDSTNLKSAGTELRRATQRFGELGRLDEFNQFVADKGRTGLGRVWSMMETKPVQGTFDLLNIGNATTAGFAYELWRTGSAAEGFKQAAAEFANALPGVEMKGPSGKNRLSWVDVFGENTDMSKWHAAGLGLMMDIFLDPMNLVPVGAAGKWIGRGGRMLAEHSGSVGDAMRAMFSTAPEMAGMAKRASLYGLSPDELRGARGAVEDLRRLHTATAEQQTIKEADRLEQIFAGMKPEERALSALAVDSPQMMAQKLADLLNAGKIDKEAARRVYKGVVEWRALAHDWFVKEEAAGLVDWAQYRQNYLYLTTAQDRNVRRQMQALGIQAPAAPPVGPGGLLPGAASKMPSAQKRSFDTLHDRLTAMVEGKFRTPENEVITTETDILNIAKARSAEHVRYMATKAFIDNVLTDGRIAAVITPTLPSGKTVKSLGVTKKGNWSSRKWERAKADIQANHPGYAVFDVREPVAIPRLKKNGQPGKPRIVEEVVAAYLMPKPMVDYLNKADGLFKDEKQLSRVMQTISSLTSPWKGWATFRAGYHSRNYQTGLLQNWLFGVGRAGVSTVPGAVVGGEMGYFGTEGSTEGAVVGAVAGAGAGMSPFIMRHLQALKMQAIADGQGKMPKAMADIIAGIVPIGVGAAASAAGGAYLAGKGDQEGQDATGRELAGGFFGGLAGAVGGMVAVGKSPRLASKLAKLPVVGNPLDRIKVKPITWQGRTYDEKGIVDLAERYGALGTGMSGLMGTNQELHAYMWSGDGASTPVGRAIAESTPDRAIKAAVDLGSVVKMPVAERAKNLARFTLGNDNPLLMGHRALGNTMDRNAKLALFYDRMMKGASPESAAATCKLAHFDYSGLSDFEKKTFGVFLPFYAWTRFATESILKAAANDPAKMSQIPKVRHAIESLSEGYQDLPVPDYFEEVQALQLPLVWKDKPLFLQLDMPIMELNRFNKKDVLAALHPVPKLMMETAQEGGYSYFMGAPVEKFADEEDPAIREFAEAPFGQKWLGKVTKHVIPTTKMGQYVTKSLFPPAGTYFYNIADASDKGEIPLRLGSDILGVTLRADDVRRVLRAQTFARRKMARDFKQRLRQEGIWRE